MPTITQRDIAQKAGVSVSAVSQILRGKSNSTFSPETVRKVLEAGRQLGYQLPNQYHSRFIGVVVRGGVQSVFRNSYFSSIYKAMETAFWEQDYHIVFSTPSDESEAGSGLPKFTTQGLVSAAVLFDDTGYAGDLLTTGMRILSVNHYVADSQMDSVTPDSFRGAYRAVTYLVENGHRRIAHLAGPSTNSNFVSRLWGYRQALEDSGLCFDPALLFLAEPGPATEEFGSSAMQHLLKNSRQQSGKPTLDFTALFAANDPLALGAMHAFREAGVRVPQDVSVIGFDDMEEAQRADPPLTTLHVPLQEMGRVAAHRLLALLEAPQATTVTGLQIVLPVSLIERASVLPTLRPLSSENSRSRAVPSARSCR